MIERLDVLVTTPAQGLGCCDVKVAHALRAVFQVTTPAQGLGCCDWPIQSSREMGSTSQRLRRGLDAATSRAGRFRERAGSVTTPAQGLGCCDFPERVTSPCRSAVSQRLRRGLDAATLREEDGIEEPEESGVSFRRKRR